jgi:hypothetical protein
VAQIQQIKEEENHMEKQSYRKIVVAHGQPRQISYQPTVAHI